MTNYGSIEHALTEFATIIIPLGQDLGGPTPAAAAVALATPLKSFFALCLLNIIAFTVGRFLIHLALNAIRGAVASLSELVNVIQRLCWRTLKGLYRHAIRTKHHSQHSSQRTRINESGSSFESWDEFARRHKMRERQEKNPAVEQAFSVLGVTPLASEEEIRRAYRRLMKRYHPDHFMQAPPLEREYLKSATIRIRQAYETVTERAFRTP